MEKTVQSGIRNAMNSTTPLVTAVIPTFQRPRLLKRAIQSVLDQDGIPLQVCIYDNASDDETADVVAGFASKDDRVVYHRHRVNIGGLANFEFGMSRVNTPYFSLLSDDDYLLRGFYRRALDGFFTNPEAMCWAGMTLTVDEDGTIYDARVKAWPREGMFTPPEGFMRMTGGMAPTWTGVVFKREVLDKVGMLDATVLGPSDLEYMLRLAIKYPFIVEKYPAAIFTLNSTSFSATQPMASFWPGWKRMLQKLEMDGSLDAAFKQRALTALRKDAERMLFRRGANALAAGRMDFVLAAADALDADCGMAGRARLLRLIAISCRHSLIAQRTYTGAYRWMERRIIRSRSALQSKYGNLLKPA